MADSSPAHAGDTMDRFYDQINTLPKLIGDLGLSVAEAQRRMDEAYLNDLAEFAKLVEALVGHDADAGNKFLNLFKGMGPTRQQITETVCEVRADLQMASVSEFGIEGTFGITVPFAVSVSASYSKRTATDFRAAALVRTTINAIPASEQVMAALLPRAGDIIHAELPSTQRFLSLLAAFQKALPVHSPVR